MAGLLKITPEFSSSVIYVNNISVENAKKFAEELYDVINTIVG